MMHQRGLTRVAAHGAAVLTHHHAGQLTKVENPRFEQQSNWILFRGDGTDWVASTEVEVIPLSEGLLGPLWERGFRLLFAPPPWKEGGAPLSRRPCPAPSRSRVMMKSWQQAQPRAGSTAGSRGAEQDVEESQGVKKRQSAAGEPCRRSRRDA